MMDIVNGQLMKILAVVFLLGTAVSQDYDYPTYSEVNMPVTSFTCEDKILGKFYADVETGCQMYHVCSRDKYGVMESTPFLCGNTTVFDQRKLVCQDYQKVNCPDSTRFYRYANSRQIEYNQLKIEKRNQAILKAQELELRPSYYPTYSEDNLPQTRFSCDDKIHGGYYADLETDCQMYHICARDKYGAMESSPFLCGNGTVFDQVRLVCKEYWKVNCQDSPKHYRNASPQQRLHNLKKLEIRNQELEKLRAAGVDTEGVQDYDYPSYSELEFPVTSFSCKDKTNGGYYADIEADCQMYHVCSKDKFGFMRSTRFLCGNGTVFDQRHLVCQDFRKVQNCKDSPRYYRNAASALLYLESRLKSEKRDKEIKEAAQFDSGRLK